MELVAFHSYFPDVAGKETRSISVVNSKHGIPDGDYGFIEFYCADPKCDCRRVMLQVLRRDGMKFVASISHAFDPPKPGDLVPDQTFVDPLNPNASYAPALLKLFLNMVLDQTYSDRLRRHYAMVKQQTTPVALTDPAKDQTKSGKHLAGSRWKRSSR